MKKELINKILVAFVVCVIVSITTCGIAYLWDRSSVNVSFVKDVFSIVMSVLAPYAAVILFTDWKEQHNKTTYSLQAKDVIVNLNEDIRLLAFVCALMRRRDGTEKLRDELIPKINQRMKDFTDHNSLTISSSHLLFVITRDNDYKKVKVKYDLFIMRIVVGMQNIIENQNSTVGDLLGYIDQHRSYIFKLNEELSEASRSYLIYK